MRKLFLDAGRRRIGGRFGDRERGALVAVFGRPDQGDADACGADRAAPNGITS